MTNSSADILTRLKTHWKKFLAPWVLVIIGILFNILAALITNYFISLNNDKLAQLDEQAQGIDNRINHYWQDRQNIERKMEFILLLLQQKLQQKLSQQEVQTQDLFVVQYIENFIQQIIKQYKITPTEHDTLNSQSVIEVVQLTQEQIVNDIDEIYFDKLTLEKEKRQLSGINSRLMSVALFLQLLGLILILAKDIQRNT
ncbi:MAG: hypothetical protein QNL62_21780 [Gammaproteobacteria bacterium]|nr:hypothetical protein [Gammaproteobacteria bacterium]